MEEPSAMLGLVVTPFYSPLISPHRDRPIGNTLITEGCYMRMFEVLGGCMGIHRSFKNMRDGIPCLPLSV